ncbi:hypothetical protein BDB01DRAFT_799416 [Pilobolus umbonatus]|nr:hypothetical protein BDB01DRAFT_799416 [Pilobolus umbonatus]
MTVQINIDVFSPIAGWLNKMVSLPFGRSRWISKFFVLLDSELRYYKDEHGETPSHILDLKRICQVIPTPTPQRPFCFRLEPLQSESSFRPWIIECQSEVDMTMWISAIQSRIIKHSSASKSTKKPSRVNSVCSYLEIIPSPDMYRLPTQSLRCTNLTENDYPSLLSRRNKQLEPIVTHDHQPQISLSTSTINSSSSSNNPSPTGAVLGFSALTSQYGSYHNNHGSKLDDHKYQSVTAQLKDDLSLDKFSPTYLSYKKRFRL